LPKLTILRGVSGSGKSSWAKQQEAVVISRDTIRVMLNGSESMHDEPGVSIAQDALIDAFLCSGRDVIVDNTNIEWKYVKELAEIGRGRDAEIEVKVFDVPLLTAIRNNAWRAANGGRNVPVHVISNQHERFQVTKGWTL